MQKVDSQGKLDIKDQKRRISKALSGESVQVVSAEDRLLVFFFCATLVRELNPTIHRTVKDVLGHTVNDVRGLDISPRGGRILRGGRSQLAEKKEQNGKFGEPGRTRTSNPLIKSSTQHEESTYSNCDELP